MGPDAAKKPHVVAVPAAPVPAPLADEASPKYERQTRLVPVVGFAIGNWELVDEQRRLSEPEPMVPLIMTDKALEHGLTAATKALDISRIAYLGLASGIIENEMTAFKAQTNLHKLARLDEIADRRAELAAAAALDDQAKADALRDAAADGKKTGTRRP